MGLGPEAARGSGRQHIVALSTAWKLVLYERDGEGREYPDHPHGNPYHDHEVVAQLLSNLLAEVTEILPDIL